MMTAKASLVRPTGMTSRHWAMQVADDATVGSAPARALTLTPVLLLDEGRNFVRVADYKLVRAGHASGLSPAGIWTPDHRSSTS
jgi:methenyltetrahydromethanopterin cyclohydrolase